jgi:hypothetical protein
MSNFAPKLQDSNDDQLWHLINESSPHYGSLASDELTRRALKNLRETIQVFNDQSSKQTGKMISMTRWIIWLTIVLVIGLAVQIILAI